MNVSCPECRSVFRVDPAKVTSETLRARCSVCGGIIPVGASIRWDDGLPTAQERTDRRAPTPMASENHTPAVATPPGGRPLTPPFASSRVTPARSTPATVTMPESPVSTTPSTERPERDTPERPPIPRTVSPPFGAPFAPPPRVSIPTPVASSLIPGLRQTPPRTAPAAVAPAAVAPAAVAPEPPRTESTGAPSRRPINPFLANDPHQKARRLARALVSDMVAYNPTKRDEGLRNSSLKQLFRDEIKKSYEEYVEQVGREFAESSAHFQDALNDVLAGGRRLF